MMGMLREVKEGVNRGVSDKDDIAAISAVPAIGSALGNIFFAAQAHATVAAIAGSDENGGTIDEHWNRESRDQGSGSWKGAPLSRLVASRRRAR